MDWRESEKSSKKKSRKIDEILLATLDTRRAKDDWLTTAGDILFEKNEDEGLRIVTVDVLTTKVTLVQISETLELHVDCKLWEMTGDEVDFSTVW